MKRIGVLWFSASGGGPDVVDLQLQPMKAELDGKIPASLGMRVRAVAGQFRPGLIETDGGFQLSRESAEDLYLEIGKWLYACPKESK